MRSKAGTTVIIFGYIALFLGLANVIYGLLNIPAGTLADADPLLTWGVVLNGVVYILPGLFLVAIGYVIAAIEENTRSQNELKTLIVDYQNTLYNNKHSQSVIEIDYGQEVKAMFTRHPWLRNKMKLQDYLINKEKRLFDYQAIYHNAKHLVNPEYEKKN